MVSPLRIALIASARYPIKQPFAGGLEAHTWALSTALRRRGHQVEVYAGPGSDPELNVRELGTVPVHVSAAAAADVSMRPYEWVAEHHAYLRLMLDLAGPGGTEFDVIHNNSLHHLPIAMSPALSTPMITTLHTPPTAWLESAIQLLNNCTVIFAAVSAHTAAAWRHAVGPATIIHNGIDVHRWTAGPGGGPLAWAGRLVPEKGAPLAIAAARRAGYPLRLAGPISDRDYFDAEIRPLLGGDIDYVGHLAQSELAELFGSASATLVTPCWEEPYGLVVTESMACGTPVCGFTRGALPELVTRTCGRLAPADDVEALARLIEPTTALARDRTRDCVVRNFSHDAMVDAYEALYGEHAA